MSEADNNLLSQYSQLGFVVVPNFFDKGLVQEIKDSIISLDIHSEKIDVYYDRNGVIRRLERVYDKSTSLLRANELILQKLKAIFSKKLNLFKDKINFKPPNGEGFYAHYDGIFEWVDADGGIHMGWHEYADDFINVLLPLDDFSKENGALEVAKVHDLEFDELLLNTKRDGSPDLIPEVESQCSFNPLYVSAGDIILFSHKCPHRSMKNTSLLARGSLYFTYNFASAGDFYVNYFADKKNKSLSKLKSLSGDL